MDVSIMLEKKIRQKKKKEAKARRVSHSYKYLLKLSWEEERSWLTVASCLTNAIKMQQILTILLQEQNCASYVQGTRGRVSNALITSCWLHTAN